MRITSIPYIQNSAGLFSCIADRPYAIFLDSAHPHYADTRFDILSAEPEMVLTSDALTQSDPFALCEKQLATFDVTLPDDMPELPFTIGAMGYFSYDVGRQLESIPEIAQNDIDLPEFCVGFYTWSIVVDHLEQKIWLITTSAEQEAQVQGWLNKKQSTAPFQLTSEFKSNMSFADYENAFHTLQKHIKDGDCYEANLCQRFSADYTGSTWQAYDAYRRKNPAPYSAYFNLGESALLSFSPERFIAVENGKAETKPIKGTRPRSNDQHEDQRHAQALLNSAKDKAENLMIVDLMRNDFGKCCVPGSITVPHLFALESFPNVHHLVSTITGTLRPDQHAFDLLKQCFPGGSITGAPKISAMHIIEKLEPHRRSVYCGTILYIDIRGKMDSNIAIRTMICNQGKIHCSAGGAIVSDSLCNKEYQETFDKVRGLTRARPVDQTHQGHELHKPATNDHDTPSC